MQKKRLRYIPTLLTVGFILPLFLLTATGMKEYNILDYAAAEVAVDTEWGEPIDIQEEYDESERIESCRYALTDEQILKNIGLDVGNKQVKDTSNNESKLLNDNFAGLYIDNANKEVVVQFAGPREGLSDKSIDAIAADAAQKKAVKLYETAEFGVRYEIVKYNEKDLDRVLDYVTDHMPAFGINYCGTDVINNNVVVGPIAELEDEEDFKRSILEALNLPFDHYNDIIVIGVIVEYSVAVQRPAPAETADLTKY